MDPNTPVEDQNLVDDNVAQEISDTAAVAPGTSVTPDDVAAAEPPADDGLVPTPELPAVDPAATMQDIAPPADGSVAPAVVSDDSAVTDSVESPAMEPEPEPQVDDKVEDDMTVNETGNENEEQPAMVPAPEPTEESDEESVVPAPEEPAATVSPAPVDGEDGDLMSVKQQALEQLSPLVSHLDLPPEKKFDTYMEILRASDDKALVQPAFDAAQAIEDEDKKAQALLDVVNEVNYLTQDHNQE